MEKSDSFIKNVLVILAICGLIVLAVIYSGGENGWQKFKDGFAPEVGGSLISFLFGYLIWGWIDKNQRRRDLGEINNKIVQLSNQIKEIADKVSYVEQKANVNNEIFSLVRKQDDKIKDLILHYSKAKPFVGRYYSKVLNSYHDTFSVMNNGFHIIDEYLSLSAFVELWKYMVLAQKERHNVGEKCLIVRIIHSNSIHIWTNEHSKYKEFTNRLLKLQKEFTESGGVIVRVFIGSGSEPDEDYKLALHRMKENNIEGKYIKQSEYHKLSYDFLLLNDEEFVLKWYSDAAGISLAGTLIQDFVEHEVREKWDDLFEELKRNGDDIVSIPSDREFKVKRQTI